MYVRNNGWWVLLMSSEKWTFIFLCCTHLEFYFSSRLKCVVDGEEREEKESPIGSHHRWFQRRLPQQFSGTTSQTQYSLKVSVLNNGTNDNIAYPELTDWLKRKKKTNNWNWLTFCTRLIERTNDRMNSKWDFLSLFPSCLGFNRQRGNNALLFSLAKTTSTTMKENVWNC